MAESLAFNERIVAQFDAAAGVGRRDLTTAQRIAVPDIKDVEIQFPLVSLLQDERKIQSARRRDFSVDGATKTAAGPPHRTSPDWIHAKVRKQSFYYNRRAYCHWGFNCALCL